MRRSTSDARRRLRADARTPDRQVARRAGAARDRRRRPASSWCHAHASLIVFALVAIAPILVIIMNSFKTTPGIFGAPFALPDARDVQPAGLRAACSAAATSC